MAAARVIALNISLEAAVKKVVHLLWWFVSYSLNLSFGADGQAFKYILSIHRQVITLQNKNKLKMLRLYLRMICGRPFQIEIYMLQLAFYR